MATPINMVNDATGVTKTGYYGYSWTTLFFGGLPALFRGDFLTFIGYFVIVGIAVVIHPLVGLVPGVIWSFLYNNIYIKSLLQKGFRFSADVEEVKKACFELGIESKEAAVSEKYKARVLADSKEAAFKEESDLSSKKYQLYLVEKYGIKKNDVLGVYSMGDDVFDSLDLVLEHAHAIDKLPKPADPSKHYGDIPVQGSLGAYKYRIRDDGSVSLTPPSPFMAAREFASFEEAEKFVSGVTP